MLALQGYLSPFIQLMIVQRFIFRARDKHLTFPACEIASLSKFAICLLDLQISILLRIKPSSFLKIIITFVGQH